MSTISKDMAHPDTTETRSNPLSTKRQISNRRILSGWKRNIAVGLTASSILVGGNAILNGNNDQQQTMPPEKPVPTLTPKPSEISIPTLSPAEVKIDDLKVSELNLQKPPTDVLNATVMIKINKEKDTPVLTKDGGLINTEAPENIESFANIKDVNGSDITEIVDSNGDLELVLSDPLVTRSKNKDTAYITIISQGKPLYIKMGQDNIDKVMVIQDASSDDIFSPIPKDAKVLDYGKVSFQQTP